MSQEKPPEQRTIDWGKLIESALTAPGNMQGQYDRFHNYSFLNLLYLRMQGVAEPIATRKRWAAIGRTVLQGSRPKEIIVPIVVDKENDEGKKEPALVGFKPVRCIYSVSETEGEPLPPVEIPEWDAETALKKLGIRRVPFTELNGNIQGASRGRDISINPVAKFPMKTLMHEVSHVVLRHTVPNVHEEYTMHRGTIEFEAEASAHLVMNELEMMDEAQASASRAYLQGWTQGERPPEKSIRRVFGAVDTIIKAGRLAISPPEQT